MAMAVVDGRSHQIHRFLWRVCAVLYAVPALADNSTAKVLLLFFEYEMMNRDVRFVAI